MSKNQIVWHLGAAINQPPEKDAVFQDLVMLSEKFTGTINNLYPFKSPGKRYPARFFGYHNIRTLLALDKEVLAHHVFFPVFYPFPILRFLKKPVIYTALTTNPNELADLKRLKTISPNCHLVAQGEQFASETSKLLSVPCHFVRSGLDIEKFPYAAADIPKKKFRLFMGSSPWNPSQFKTKGLLALVELLKSDTSLELVILWRGSGRRQFETLIKDHGVNGQIEIISDYVDVNQILKRCHAGIVLSANGNLVKAYPHSLMETLLCGRPVIVSQNIEMANLIDKKKIGVCVDKINVEELRQKIAFLRKHFPRIAMNVAKIDRAVFDRRTMVSDYQAIYSGLGIYPAGE